jgi:hypothetical protein
MGCVPAKEKKTMDRRRLSIKSVILAAVLMVFAALSLVPMLATGAAKAALPAVTISLTSKGIVVMPSSLKAGDYRVVIKNSTSMRRGLEIIGVDKATSPTVRYTKILRPSKSESFRWYFASGKTAYVRDLLSCTHGQRSCVIATFGQMSKAIDVD